MESKKNENEKKYIVELEKDQILTQKEVPEYVSIDHIHVGSRVIISRQIGYGSFGEYGTVLSWPNSCPSDEKDERKKKFMF